MERVPSARLDEVQLGLDLAYKANAVFTERSLLNSGALGTSAEISQRAAGLQTSFGRVVEAAGVFLGSDVWQQGDEQYLHIMPRVLLSGPTRLGESSQRRLPGNHRYSIAGSELDAHAFDNLEITQVDKIGDMRIAIDREAEKLYEQHRSDVRLPSKADRLKRIGRSPVEITKEGPKGQVRLTAWMQDGAEQFTVRQPIDGEYTSAQTHAHFTDGKLQTITLSAPQSLDAIKRRLPVFHSIHSFARAYTRLERIIRQSPLQSILESATKALPAGVAQTGIYVVCDIAKPAITVGFTDKISQGKKSELVGQLADEDFTFTFAQNPRMTGVEGRDFTTLVKELIAL